MGQSVLYGSMARYSAAPPTLISGDSGALQVDINGAVKLSNVKPVGIGTSSQYKTYGNPGRVHTAQVTLQDGDYVALLLNEQGQLIIS